MRVSVVTVTNRSKKQRLLRWAGILFLAMLTGWVTILLFPVSERPVKPFFADLENRPLVIAHQGGEHLAPSNTMEAFRMADEMGVDVIEFDVHMTSDGYLVAIHDNTVDRTTDGTGRVNDMTLAELRELDAADYFQDLHGEFSFRGQGIMIPTVEEIFSEFPDMAFNIELKATNDEELHRPMAERLWELMVEYNMEDQVLAASFNQRINDMMTEISDGRAAVSGGVDEITRFVVFHKFFLNGLYRPKVDAVQIPTEESIFNLKDDKIIRGAHRRGMEVYYWTINDEEKMRELIELGADGIVTDRPDLMLKILEEYE
ncbi:glycerophosphodiester phosphodiesterase [Evansella clarkii]|jgi:glycerophosphoryl diester phosphodiesterase|uniref:glycerophosphodiester phosphodiesterase n=1 Tax=Evansella clarkii TaxID=79879 RepID=UPI0009980C23|nr:glycerophosphodiester phosphodiesterase [Evansella clarkii]